MMLDSGAITDDIKSGFVHLKTAFALGPKAHIFLLMFYCLLLVCFDTKWYQNLIIPGAVTIKAVLYIGYWQFAHFPPREYCCNVMFN